MIAAENDAAGINIGFAGQCENEFTEIGGLHAGVAAVLIDLIAGRLNQDRFGHCCGSSGKSPGAFRDARCSRTGCPHDALPGWRQ